MLVNELISSVVELVIKAKETKKMTFCVQPNSIRETAKEKEVKVKNLGKKYN